MIEEKLRHQHMLTLSRVTKAAARYMELRQNNQDDPEYVAARMTLLAELTALQEIARIIDEAAGRIERYYARSAWAWLKSCNVTPGELEAYQRALKSQPATQEH